MIKSDLPLRLEIYQRLDCIHANSPGREDDLITGPNIKCASMCIDVRRAPSANKADAKSMENRPLYPSQCYRP